MAVETLKQKRDQAIEQLSDAFAEDAFDVAEFERRLAAAHRAENASALAETVKDLPKRTMGPGSDSASVAGSDSASVPATVPARKEIRAVFGSLTRSGPWHPPQTQEVSATFGSVELDFREAVLAPGVTEIEVNARFGSVEIIVPPTLAVEVDGTALFGSFDHIERAPRHVDGTQPVLRIKGRALFGAVDVQTKLAERKRLRG